MKEVGDDIMRRIDRSDTERREERRDLEERLRRVEQQVPQDLQEQLLNLHTQNSQTRATGKLLVTIFSFALSIIGLGVTLVTVFS